MAALYFHIEPADDPALVWLRFSLAPNPERKTPQLVERNRLNAVLLFLLDAASRPEVA